MDRCLAQQKEHFNFAKSVSFSFVAQYIVMVPPRINTATTLCFVRAVFSDYNDRCVAS